MGETIQARRERLRISAFVTRRQASHGSLLIDALDAGFGSYAQFHRAFRRVMGVTPRSWLGNQRHYGG
jgi:AraC-like DNA-binding protein